jgi:hypothetical protein
MVWRGAARGTGWEGVGGDAEARRGEGTMMAGAREGPWAHEGDPAGGRTGRVSGWTARITRCPGAAPVWRVPGGSAEASRPRRGDPGRRLGSARCRCRCGGAGGRGRTPVSGAAEAGLAEEVPGALQRGLAGAVGEEAEVANADEGLGDDVEAEAADELLGGQGHDLDAVTVARPQPGDRRGARWRGRRGGWSARGTGAPARGRRRGAWRRRPSRAGGGGRATRGRRRAERERRGA